MPGSICGADIVRQTEALEGRQIIAPGKAQRRPGLACSHEPQALKGRHNRCSRRESAMRTDCFALTGLELFCAGEPRALPWAIILRPVGAAKGGGV